MAFTAEQQLWVMDTASRKFFYLETKLKTTKIMVDDTFEGFVMPRKPTAHPGAQGNYDNIGGQI